MFKKRMNRMLALALTAVFALSLSPPAGAAGWSVLQPEGLERFVGFYAHVLDRLGLAPHWGVVLKCGDQGASIDPNGCPKATAERSQSGAERSQARTRLRGAGSR